MSVATTLATRLLPYARVYMLTVSYSMHLHAAACPCMCRVAFTLLEGCPQEGDPRAQLLSAARPAAQMHNDAKQRRFARVGRTTGETLTGTAAAAAKRGQWI